MRPESGVRRLQSLSGCTARIVVTIPCVVGTRPSRLQRTPALPMGFRFLDRIPDSEFRISDLRFQISHSVRRMLPQKRPPFHHFPWDDIDLESRISNLEFQIPGLQIWNFRFRIRRTDHWVAACPVLLGAGFSPACLCIGHGRADSKRKEMHPEDTRPTNRSDLLDIRCTLRGTIGSRGAVAARKRPRRLHSSPLQTT